MRCSGFALAAALGFGAAAHAEAPEGRVARITVRGQRKVEPEAIRMNVATKAGKPLDRKKLAEDVRSLWRLGFFEDVQVEVTALGRGDLQVTYVVKEKPSIRKILVSGNDEIDIDKINEVLDLKLDAILSIADVKRNEVKIRDLYVEKGFYLAEVSHELRRISDTEVDVVYKVREHAKVEVRSITFLGNVAAPSDELKAAMETQEGGYFSWLTSSGTYQEDAFQRDLARITGYYYDRGYINVKLGRAQIALSPDKRYLHIVFPIEEGPRYRVGKVDVQGDLVESREAYLSRLGVRGGEYFNKSKLLEDITRLSDGYKDLGYAYVNVTPLTAIDNDRLIVDLTFDIQKGQKVYFERIHVRGNTRTRDKVIRREVKIIEGELYNQTLLDASRRRVTALGFFERVEVNTRRGSADDRIEVSFEVQEKPTGTFQIGAGFSSAESFIAMAQISQSNLFGRGQTLALQAQISGIRQLYSLRFIDPYFLDSDWTFAFSLYNSVQNRGNFNREATGGDLTWGYPLHEDVRLFLTYKLEDVDVQTSGRASPFGTPIAAIPSGARVANLFDDGITSSARFSVNWDTRDNRLFPTRGFFQSASAEYARPELGSENVFDRYTGFSRWYYPVWGPLVYKLNLEMGFVTSSRDEGVPIFERFFVGGINDVRGFAPNTLGPRMSILRDQDPNAPLNNDFLRGGDKQMILNHEVEFPIFEKVGIKGVVFSDAGWAWDDDENMFKEIAKLRHSWGFGFRWFSPIGPLRFEWGLPFDPQPGEDPIKFEFTIGNFF